MQKKTITILGSTGSIGKNTVDIIARYPEKFQVVALTANNNIDKLIEQAKLLEPRYVVLADSSKNENYQKVKDALRNSNTWVKAGKSGLLEVTSFPVDITVSAIVGAAGLEPTMAAIKHGKTVALANKETLVCGGKLVMDEVAKNKTTLLPIDSEHNAIFQVLNEEHRENIDKIILTASGGPFRDLNIDDMRTVTPKQALKHPNWDMGAKISIDSATMMNKGLEIIEAAYLFGVSDKKIDVVVHPESIVHSMVSYSDGSVLAQMGEPDMRTPISYCLAYPNRIKTPVKKLDLAKIGKLNFYSPDVERFPALKLARLVLKKGGIAPAVMNAANEIAVDAFLKGKIGFLEIVKTVEKVVESTPKKTPKTIKDIMNADLNARKATMNLIDQPLLLF